MIIFGKTSVPTYFQFPDGTLKVVDLMFDAEQIIFVNAINTLKKIFP